jgi:hypothetical protein
MFGFDDRGLPRVMYHRHDEFMQECKELPYFLVEKIEEMFWRDDPGPEQWYLRDHDGYIVGSDFAEWCARQAGGEKHLERLQVLGQIIDQINDKIRANREEAHNRGELEHADGERPDYDFE